MKCYFCENEATRKDYRTLDGITGKVIVCDECSSLSDSALLDREHQMKEDFEECFNDSYIDTVLEIALDKFWECVNNELNEHETECIEEFMDLTDIEPHEDSLETWRDNWLSKIAEEAKKQLI